MVSVQVGVAIYAKKVITENAETKPLTMEDVRGILAEKSREGYTIAIKEIMAKFGAKKLSEVKPEDYPALLSQVEELTNA